jgi:hypothetical protein
MSLAFDEYGRPFIIIRVRAAPAPVQPHRALAPGRARRSRAGAARDRRSKTGRHG